MIAILRIVLQLIRVTRIRHTANRMTSQRLVHTYNQLEMNDKKTQR